MAAAVGQVDRGDGRHGSATRSTRSTRPHAAWPVDHAAQPAQRVALQLGVVLDRAVVAARDDDELGARVGRAPRQLARVRDRDALVALGVQEQQRHREALDRGVERVLGEERLERGHVGAEVELAAAQAARTGRPSSPGRSPPRPARRAGSAARIAR